MSNKILIREAEANIKNADIALNSLSDTQRRAIAVIGITLLSAFKDEIEALIAFFRAQLLLVLEKQFKNFLRKQQFISDVSLLVNSTNTISSASDFIDRLPIEALNVYPPLFNIASSAKEFANKSAYKARNTAYLINQMNQRDASYNFLVQQIDNYIRDLRGLLNAIEASLEEAQA